MNYFLLKINKHYKKVDQSEIIYFQVDGKYIDVVLKDKKYAIRSSVKNLMPLLDNKFIRTHTSFVINSEYLDYINTESKHVVLKENSEIPYSRGYRENIFKAFNVI